MWLPTQPLGATSHYVCIHTVITTLIYCEQLVYFVACKNVKWTSLRRSLEPSSPILIEIYMIQDGKSSCEKLWWAKLLSTAARVLIYHVRSIAQRIRGPHMRGRQTECTLDLGVELAWSSLSIPLCHICEQWARVVNGNPKLMLETTKPWVISHFEEVKTALDSCNTMSGHDAPDDYLSKTVWLRVHLQHFTIWWYLKE